MRDALPRPVRAPLPVPRVSVLLLLLVLAPNPKKDAMLIQEVYLHNRVLMTDARHPLACTYAMTFIRRRDKAEYDQGIKLLGTFATVRPRAGYGGGLLTPWLRAKGRGILVAVPIPQASLGPSVHHRVPHVSRWHQATVGGEDCWIGLLDSPS